MRVWLANLRKANGLTQKDMADKLMITEQAYYYIERGKRQRNMSLTFMASLSDIFGISLDYIKEMELNNDADKDVRRHTELLS